MDLLALCVSYGVNALFERPNPYFRLGRQPASEGFLLSIQPEHGGAKLWMRDDVTGETITWTYTDGWLAEKLFSDGEGSL